MATKITRKVNIDGKLHWIHANNEQEYAEKVIMLNGGKMRSENKHNFKDYALNWFELYSKPNIATVTAETYERQLNRYLIPLFGEMSIEDITTNDIQKFFNKMTGAVTTKAKAKTVLNMILEAAVDDDIIIKNPLKSKRLKITGAESKSTKTYSVEQMRFLFNNLHKIKNPLDRTFLAMQAFHPLRLEETLGLKWKDIDIDTMTFHVRRAVTHPTRNKPEIKSPKTPTSKRGMGLVQFAAKYLIRGNDDADDDFIFGGKNPLSYQQVKRMCERIRNDVGFDDKITPMRFRATILTDIYDQTRDIKAAQAAAGHTTSAMTLKYYVKGRGDSAQTADVINQLYGAG